jgi:hypothetical protein
MPWGSTRFPPAFPFQPIDIFLGVTKIEAGNCQRPLPELHSRFNGLLAGQKSPYIAHPALLNLALFGADVAHHDRSSNEKILTLRHHLKVFKTQDFQGLANGSQRLRVMGSLRHTRRLLRANPDSPKTPLSTRNMGISALS